MDFFFGLTLIAIAALFAMNLRLAWRLREVEHRLAAGARSAPAPGDVDASAPSEPARPGEPPALATLFETLIGGRLLIWVGGVALVVAAVFLIRYSIEIGLITPEMRMIAAAAFGLALLGLGEWAHRSLRLADDPRISQALVGAGLAILYAAVYGSYILYGFLDLNVAAALMLVITVGALGLALRHGVGTAALGLIGGFLTPWLVGDPEVGALPLLAYLALLDAAVFAIAWRRGWGWLVGVAVLASFAWTGYLLTRPVPDAIAGGWFALGLGIVAGLLRPAGTSLTWIQPVSIAAVQVTILTARFDIETLGWLAYAAIAIASVAITRIKEHPPAVPAFVLTLGLLLIPVRDLFHDESGIASAAAGMTLLFGGAALAIAVQRRSRLWAALACFGFAGPVLVLRWSAQELLPQEMWGLLPALLAAGPLALVFIRRAQAEAGFDWVALLPAATAAALLALAALDLVPSSGLSIAWLVLAILFIAAGMGLKNLALRVAGLVLLTITVVKLFVVDASALDGVLRILSFGVGGAALIVLGRFYGVLLRGDRASQPSEPQAAR